MKLRSFRLLLCLTLTIVAATFGLLRLYQASVSPVRPDVANPSQKPISPTASESEIEQINQQVTTPAKIIAAVAASDTSASSARRVKPIPANFSVESLIAFLDNPDARFTGEINELVAGKVAAEIHGRYAELSSTANPSIGLNRLLLGYELHCMRDETCPNQTKIAVDQGMPARFWPLLEAGNFEAVVNAMYLESGGLPIGEQYARHQRIATALALHAEKGDCLAQGIVADGIYAVAENRLVATAQSPKTRYEGLLLNLEMHARLARPLTTDHLIMFMQRVESVLDPAYVLQSRQRARERVDKLLPKNESLWHPSCIALREIVE